LNHPGREELLICARLSRRFASARRLAMSAYDKGALAARMGMEKDDNPYPRGTHAYSDWKAGYEASVEVEEAMKFDYDWAD
jgi:hypothetical protein